MGGGEARPVGDSARHRVHAHPAARGRPRGGGTGTERRIDDEGRPRRRGAGEGSRGPGGDPEAERRAAARIRRWPCVREPGGPAAAWGVSRVRHQSEETGEEPRNRAHRDRTADGEGVLLAQPLRNVRADELRAAMDQLRSTSPPWVHLVVFDRGEKPETVLARPPGFAVRTIDGRGARTKSGLLSEFARVLEFPAGSGRNWDAFEEMLADLEWLPAQGYLLIVSHADQLLAQHPEDYDTFIEILETVAKEWATPRHGEFARAAVPFHVCLVVPRGRAGARAD